MSLRLTDTHEEQVLWRGLQPAASASAGVYTAKMCDEFGAVLRGAAAPMLFIFSESSRR